MAKTNEWGDTVAEAESPLDWGDKPAAQRDLPKGVTASEAGAGRGRVNPQPEQEPAPMGDPMGSGASEIMAVAQPKRESVLQGLDMPDVPISDATMAENARLSGRDYAERTPTAMDPRRAAPALRTPGKFVPNAPDRGPKEVAQDVVYTAATLPSAFQSGIGDVASVATGGLVGPGLKDDARKYEESLRGKISSPQLAQEQREFQDVMRDPNASAFDVAKFILSRPTFAGNQAASAAASFAVPLNVIKAAKLAGVVLTPARATSIAMTVNDLMNAGQAFNDTDSDLAGKYLAAGVAGAGSRLIGKATAGGAEGAIARSAAAGKAASRRELVTGALLKEPAQEFVENASQSIGQDLGEGKVPDLQSAVKQGVAGAVVAPLAAGAMALPGRGGQPAQPTAEDIARAKGFLVDSERVKRLRDAGEKDAADAMQRKLDGQSADSELGALAGTGFAQDPLFQQQYREMRSAGVKPAEAGSRAAVLTGFSQLAQQAGVSDKAIQAGLVEAGKRNLSDLPGFLDRYLSALTAKGIGEQVEAGTVAASLQAARDEALTAATDAVYTPQGTAVKNIARLLGADVADTTSAITELEGRQAVATVATPQAPAGNFGGGPNALPVTTVAGPLAPEDTPIGPPAQRDGEGPVLQNRNRATPSSIAQMRSIAAAPDYGRLGFSRDFANGAPVVTGADIPAAQLGRQDVAVASDGRRIPVQYAVVEAPQVQASNTADGLPNAAYGAEGQLSAIAGNGRIAGLQAAHQAGTASTYREELAADSLHGIDPKVIEGMRAPVLVRVMPQEAVTADIGDVSNTVGNLDLSAVEQASNDARRVDLDALSFAEDGSITPTAVRQFVQAMPQAEQGGLIDTNGQPTRQAMDRLNAAVFHRAYGNDRLVRLYAQAQDPEARLVLSALAQVAPKMARLEGAGELDIRPIVADAAQIAVNARRDGISIAKAAAQLDLDADAAVGVVLDLFASSPRSVKPIIAALSNAADFAYTESTKPGEDMFGEVPRSSRQDVLERLRNDTQRSQGLEQPAGRGTAAEDAAARTARAAGPEDARATQAAGAREEVARDDFTSPMYGRGDDLLGPAPNESQQQAERIRREREDQQRRQQQNAPDDFTLTGSDRPADQGAARGQGSLFARGKRDYAGPYETDLFGNPVPRQQALPESGGGTARAEPRGTGVRGDAQPAPAVPGDAAAKQAGEFYVDTLVSAEVQRPLGADRIRKPADLAQATQYLYKSAVERFDAIVTDAAGKPLAVVGNFKGATSQTSVYPATLVAEAIRVPGAAQIWLSHNHPSGNPQLSSADMMLMSNIASVFRGSGIETMGIMAVSKGSFYFQSGPNGRIETGTIADPQGKTSVPVYERELADDRVAPLSISSPQAAKALAKDFYDRAKAPGLLLLDAQNQVAAWVPLDGALRGKLRDTGGLRSLYQAISRSNASSAIFVHAGELDGAVQGRPIVANIGGALRGIDVRPLDSVNVATGQSLAEQGLDDFGKAGVFFARGDGNLIVQHNITADNLLHADRMGGLAVPSLAVTKVSQPLENFGEVTLLGDANMATPSHDTKVFGADIYSPRYPTVTYRVRGPVADKIDALLAPYRKEGEYRYHGGADEKLDDLTSDKAFQRYAAQKLGEADPLKVGYHELRTVAAKVFADAGAEERLFQGFTYSGNRRYIEHTLDRVVAILKKDLRGGENFNYGAGSLRAKFTPQFRTLSAIRKSQEKLISRGQFEVLKEEINKELLDLAQEMVPNGGFRSTDTAMAILEDGAKMGLQRAAKEYGVELSPETQQRAYEFMQKLRNLPTEYFEAKVLRAMDLGEFKAAVVPNDAKPEVRALLERKGLTVYEYDKEQAGDRAAVVKQAAEAIPDGVFRRDQQSPGGLSVPEAQKVTNDLTAKWQNGPKVRVVDTPADLPGNAPADVRGMYANGTAWVVANQHRAGAEPIRQVVGRTLAHEAIAHYGLREMLGKDDWERLMDQVQRAIAAGNKPLTALRDQVDKAYRDENGQPYLSPRLQSDEIAAKAVEQAIGEDGEFRPGYSFLKWVYAKIASFLRDTLGISVTFTHTELQGMLVAAQRHLEAGKRAMGGGPVVVAASRASERSYSRPGERVAFRALIDRLLKGEQQEAQAALFNLDVGPIDIVRGEAGDAAKGYSDGYGLLHIQAKHPEVDLHGLLDVVAGAKETQRKGNTVELEDQNHRFVVKLDWQGAKKTWLLTAFDPSLGTGRIGGDPNVAGPTPAGDASGGIVGREVGKAKSDEFHTDSQLARGAAATGAQQTPQGAALTPARPLSMWRDATGRVQFAPGQALYNLVGKAAGPLLDRLALKSASPELTRALRMMRVQVAKAQDTAAAVAGEANKLSAAEREMVSDIIERELAAGTVPPEHAVRLAALVNGVMGRQTDELVRLGMLGDDAAARWRDQYLPRFYESKLTKRAADAWSDAMRRLVKRPRVMKGISGQHLRGRGLYETIPESQLQQYEQMGWEVRDPDYTPGLPTTDGTVQVWRDFSRAERERMGEIRDVGFRFVMGYMQTQRDIALGQMFEALAGNAAISSRTANEKFSVQVPTGTVQGTGAKTYGKLAGRWVAPETLSHLSSIEEAQSEALQLYRKAMSVWKESKTVLNPVSHVNNVVSNLTMAHFAGVSYWDAHKYMGAIKDLASGAAIVKEAKDAGLFLGTLSEAELMNVLPPELRDLAKKQEGTGEKIGRSAFNLMSFYLRRPMGWAYQNEDTFFRFLIYRDARKRGMEPQDAVDYAQKFIFAYDDLPKGARRIRDFGIPFFSYTYKATPALLHTAMTHPVRFAAPAALLWAINAAAYAIAADDDDDWKEALRKYLQDPEHRKKVQEAEELEREHLPPWMKGTTALLTPKTLRLGMDEVTKLPVFIDISRIIPGGDLFDVSPNAGGLPIPQPITPSHPLFTTAVAMIGNKDLFFGKDIVDSNDTKGEAFAKRADWIWKQMTPAIAVGNYHWERGMNALAQATGREVRWMPEEVAPNAVATGVGRDGLPVQPRYAAMQTFGVKARPIDLDKAESIDQNQRNKMIRDIEAELRSLRRLNGLGAISDRAYERAEELARTKQERVKEGLTVDGEKKD